MGLVVGGACSHSPEKQSRRYRRLLPDTPAAYENQALLAPITGNQLPLAT